MTACPVLHRRDAFLHVVLSTEIPSMCLLRVGFVSDGVKVPHALSVHPQGWICLLRRHCCTRAHPEYQGVTMWVRAFAQVNKCSWRGPAYDAHGNQGI